MRVGPRMKYDSIDQITKFHLLKVLVIVWSSLNIWKSSFCPDKYFYFKTFCFIVKVDTRSIVKKYFFFN